MDKPIVFMFSGQGAQYYQMGRELYDNHPRFKVWMDHCDELAEPLLGRSMVEMIYDQSKGKTDPFDQLQYSNPALLSIEYCLARILMENGIQPDYLLGYSLGEFSAAVVGGAIDLEDGLELVINAAKLLNDQLPPGGMLAIIESTDLIEQKADWFSKVSLTGRNFAKNFVVGGHGADLDVLDKQLKAADVMTQRLPVRHGFHTALLDPVESDFKDLAGDVLWGEAEISTWSSLLEGEVSELSESYFWRVIREPVNFDSTIKAMLKTGDYCFIDVCPSGTLATSVKYIKPQDSQSVHYEVMNQFGKNLRTLDNLLTAVSG